MKVVPSSDVADSVLETAEGMHRVGILSDAEMAEFVRMCGKRCRACDEGILHLVGADPTCDQCGAVWHNDTTAAVADRLDEEEEQEP